MPNMPVRAAAPGLPKFSPTRRRLGALLAAGAAVALPALPAIAAVPIAVDPFPGYLSELNNVFAMLDGGKYRDEAEADRLMDRWGEIDRLAMTSRPTTVAGAIACLEYARREYVQFKMSDDETSGDDGDRLTVALLDGALSFLRRLPAA